MDVTSSLKTSSAGPYHRASWNAVHGIPQVHTVEEMRPTVDSAWHDTSRDTSNGFIDSSPRHLEACKGPI
ncbi:hypothetical protein TNCV_3718861 [Trichonephila clavipes]|nr:hypothetical protein TNCV_3718861 [Trichonephila clavipes]